MAGILLGLTWSWAIAALLATMLFYLLRLWPRRTRTEPRMKIFRIPAGHSIIRDTIGCPICTQGFAVDEEVALVPLLATEPDAQISYEPAHVSCIKRALLAFKRWGLA